MIKVDLFKDYENAKILSVDDFRGIHSDSTFQYDELDNQEIDGIPISVTRNQQGKLEITFILLTVLQLQRTTTILVTL